MRLTKHNLVPALVFLWPFICLWPYVVSFKGRHLLIGNDFYELYYKYKAYLLACLVDFKIPLWSPSEGTGYPFYSSPFTQTFYPLNLPLAVYYRLAGGYTVLDHQRFTILGISIFALGLYFWLKQLRLPPRAVIFGTLLMTVSFKVTEIVRFPNAVHTAAWYPWILFAVTGIFLGAHRREFIKYGLWFCLFSTCFLTAGYPYYVYYSIFLFGPYLLVLLIPKLRMRVFGCRTVDWKNAAVTASAAGLAALLICGFYLYKMFGLLRQTTDRAGADFTYSTRFVFNFNGITGNVDFRFFDTIGSLIFPPAASAEGWFYFSMAGFLLIALYLFSGRYGASADNAEESGGASASPSGGARYCMDFCIKAFLLVWIAMISYITYGERSHLFKFLWHTLPFFSHGRVWGRMNIILVPVIAWLAALAYANFELMVSDENYFRRKSGAMARVISLYVPVCAITLQLQLYMLHHRLFDAYWNVFYASRVPAAVEYLRKSGYAVSLTPVRFSTLAGIIFIASGIIAFTLILGALLVASKRFFQSDRAKRGLLLAALACAVPDVLSVGPWMWTSGISPVMSPSIDIQRSNVNSFKTSRARGNVTISFSDKFNAGILPNWYFSRYAAFRRKAFAEEPKEARQLLGINDGKKLYFSKNIHYAAIRRFLDDAGRFAGFENILSYTGEELRVQVDVPVDGYASFIDNWDEDWEAYVDGLPAEIHLLFGTYKSVSVPAGRHEIRFSYVPKILYRGIRRIDSEQ